MSLVLRSISILAQHLIRTRKRHQISFEHSTIKENLTKRIVSNIMMKKQNSFLPTVILLVLAHIAVMRMLMATSVNNAELHLVLTTL